MQKQSLDWLHKLSCLFIFYFLCNKKQKARRKILSNLYVQIVFVWAFFGEGVGFPSLVAAILHLLCLARACALFCERSGDGVVLGIVAVLLVPVLLSAISS